MKRLIDLDIETIEEKPLTELQKQKIRQGIHAKKSPKRAFKKWIAVAAATNPLYRFNSGRSL